LKTYLKKSADKDLYTHVRKVMSHVVKHCPHKAVDDVEEISYLIKHENKKNLKMNEFMKTNVTKAYAKPGDEYAAKVTNQIIEKAKPLFKVSIHIL